MMKLNQYQWDPEVDLRGRGSFAEVFEAKDHNGDSVALKIYRDSVAQSSSGGSLKGKYSLENEFSKGKHLSHTNIIRYVGLEYLVHTNYLNKEASFPVLIMEYADAGSLESRLTGLNSNNDYTSDTTETLNENDKLTVAKEILEGLTYLHDQGIIHRDLKPANILFKTDRMGRKVAKITDFGISRDNLAQNTGSTTFGIGTVHYMAPEQFLPKTYGFEGSISNQTDIWAFGVIMYRMFTETLPFKSQEQVTDEDPDFNKVPVKYRSLVKTCLQKHASKRFATAKDVLNALNVATVNNGGRVKPVPEPVPVPKPVNIKRALIWGLSIIVVAVLGWTITNAVRHNMRFYVTNQTLQMTDSVSGTSYSYTYTGWLKDDKPEGQGTKIFKDGDRYEGESKNGHADGKGKEYFKQTSGGFNVYEGTFKNGRPDGTGMYTYVNGDKYTGEMKEGLRTGQGTFFINRDGANKGDKYVGGFSKDLMDGRGIYTWAGGQKYEGDFVNDEIHGKGKMTYSGGNVYDGDFVNGQKHGTGTMHYSDSSSYVGGWNNGQREGDGVYTWADGRTFTGIFKNNVREGQGTLILTNKNKYVGTWSGDKMNGYITIYDANGTVLSSGYYVDNEPQR